MPRDRRHRTAARRTALAAAVLLATAFPIAPPRALAAEAAAATGPAESSITTPQLAERRSGGRAAAEEASSGPVPGSAGTYFILFDAYRKPLLGAYWLAENAIGVAGGPLVETPTPDSVQVVAVDRYLFPRTVVDTMLFWLFRNSYDNLPADYADPTTGNAFTVTGRRLPNPILKEARDEEPFTVTFTWHGPVTKQVKGQTLTGYPFAATDQFDFERGSLRREDSAAVRIYIATLGFGVSKALWNRIAEVVVGRAVSSADLAFEIELRRKATPAAHACLRDLRASVDYAQYQAALAALEQRSATLMEQGMTDIIANGPAPYLALEDRYRIIRRFMDCVPLP